jgi:hypothetical protein
MAVYRCGRAVRRGLQCRAERNSSCCWGAVCAILCLRTKTGSSDHATLFVCVPPHVTFWTISQFSRNLSQKFCKWLAAQCPLSVSYSHQSEQWWRELYSTSNTSDTYCRVLTLRAAVTLKSRAVSSPILFGWLNRGGWDGQGVLYAWGRICVHRVLLGKPEDQNEA